MFLCFFLNLFLGTFLPYDTVNGLQDPAKYGFPAATSYIDNSTQYIGFGTFPFGMPCTYQSPGYISTNPSAPGIYITCLTQKINGMFNEMFYFKDNSYYLLNHPDLQWVNFLE